MRMRDFSTGTCRFRLTRSFAARTADTPEDAADRPRLPLALQFTRRPLARCQKGRGQPVARRQRAAPDRSRLQGQGRQGAVAPYRRCPHHSACSVRTTSTADYVCTKAGGSLGMFDVIAVGPTGVRCIQVKANKYLEREQLKALAVPVNVTLECWRLLDGEPGTPRIELL